MMKDSIFANNRIRTGASTLLVLVLLLLTAADVGALEIVQKQVWRNTIEAQGSFNYARREIFRQLYGNGLTLAVRYERSFGDRIGLGIRVSRIQMSNHEDNALVRLKYLDFTVAPVMTYALARTDGFRLFAGGGAGLSFRKVTLESYAWDELSTLEFEYEVKQSETGLYGLLLLGADLRLSGSVFAGVRVTYDRNFLGDVTTGDFGDTGGFNFGESLGLGF